MKSVRSLKIIMEYPHRDSEIRPMAPINDTMRIRLRPFGEEILEHVFYSPDLSTCDFHMLAPLRKFPAGQRVKCSEGEKTAVSQWFCKQRAEFLSCGIYKLLGAATRRTKELSASPPPFSSLLALPPPSRRLSPSEISSPPPLPLPPLFRSSPLLRTPPTSPSPLPSLPSPPLSSPPSFPPPSRCFFPPSWRLRWSSGAPSSWPFEAPPWSSFPPPLSSLPPRWSPERFLQAPSRSSISEPRLLLELPASPLLWSALPWQR
ncbi:hypothetical protein J437_LFUL001366 [Ladona fulva]|uniref:Uncharacterized protein n=1 Tax=Ladona fulva TaxID=123851 RepID=A0A8K0JXD2_LADFU|nr:hypothetical protein J437_LFUL001366 [Ladona fulva]